MKKQTIVWCASITSITFLFLYQPTHETLLGFTKLHPYLMGFCKFAILAFLGELLGIRISSGYWEKPSGFMLRILAWGLMGIAVAFVLPMSYLATNIFIPQNALHEIPVLRALLASVIFNLLPGPMTIIYHKLVESSIDLLSEKGYQIQKTSFAEAVQRIDWDNLIRNILLKLNLILFIPINTIVFLLPIEIRVLVAAYASILLGAVLGYRKAKLSGRLA